VTQGGISRAIAREEHLGFALFERLGRRNALTAAGQDYLQAVEPAVMAIEAASAAARRRRHGPQLRLSVIPTLFSHWLIPRLPDFNRRHPQIMLSFAPYRRDDPLNAPEIDAWIRVGSQHWPAGVEAEYVIGRDLIPICHPRELQGPNPIRSEQDLLNRPLLFHTNYPGNWASWMQARGLDQPCPAPVADFETVALLVQAVAAGMGTAMVQRCLVEEDLASGRVALALDAPVHIERGYFLCQQGSRPHGGLKAVSPLDTGAGRPQGRQRLRPGQTLARIQQALLSQIKISRKTAFQPVHQSAPGSAKHPLAAGTCAHQCGIAEHLAIA
jgi:DNA-binding transcriptional LysR family regulator